MFDRRPHIHRYVTNFTAAFVLPPHPLREILSVSMTFLTDRELIIAKQHCSSNTNRWDATLKAFPELMTYCIKLRRRNCDEK